MHSLWRLMARLWLGGEGSERLTGDSALADLLLPEETLPEFCVTRDKRTGTPAPAAPRVSEVGEREETESDASFCG